MIKRTWQELFNQPVNKPLGMRALLGSSAALLVVCACGGTVSQEIVTAGVDPGRSGWASVAPAIGPDVVKDFEVRFRVKLTGSVMGQPLVSAGAVYVGTDQDWLYRIDAVTGSIVWQRSLGRPEPAGSGRPFACDDVAPSLGILSTPVIDPAAQLIYVVARSWDGSHPESGGWVAHAVSLASGAEAAGWPIPLAGSAAGNPADRLEAATLLQRAALLVSHGRLWVAFAGACDRYPFRGWVGSVGLKNRDLALWPVSPNDPGGGAGIWQSGGGPAEDGAGQVLLSTGDGNPNPGPQGRNPLAQCVLRLNVDGPTPVVTDSFCPANGPELDALDLDVGSGNPRPLPTGFGASGGRLVVQVSKDGVIYLLDRDHLNTLLAESTGHEPMLSRPAVWPVDHLVFIAGTEMQLPGRPRSPEAHLRAYRIQGGATPSIALAATAPEALAYGSGSPLVTSDSRRPGSALVWIVARQDVPGNRPAELRAYDADPVAGTLRIRFERLVGSVPKFSQPATDGQRIYVATDMSELIAFGSPPSATFQAWWILVPALLGGMALIAVIAVIAVRRMIRE
jgi:hypothetical protein